MEEEAVTPVLGPAFLWQCTTRGAFLNHYSTRRPACNSFKEQFQSFG